MDALDKAIAEDAGGKMPEAYPGEAHDLKQTIRECWRELLSNHHESPRFIFVEHFGDLIK